MKPSELIERRTRAAIERTERLREEYGREPVDPGRLYEFVQGEEILRYLDEQAQLSIVRDEAIAELISLVACGSRDLSKFTALLVDWREGIERILPTDRKEAK